MTRGEVLAAHTCARTVSVAIRYTLATVAALIRDEGPKDGETAEEYSARIVARIERLAREAATGRTS